MAGLYVKAEDKWNLPKSIWTKVGGVWRVCTNVYIREDDIWHEMIRSVDLDTSGGTDFKNFNLYEYVGSPTEPLSLIFNIPFDATIGSDGPTLPSWCPYWCATTRTNLPKRPTAFTVGNFATGSTVIINNNGYISGGGGYGGAGGNSFAKGPNYPNLTSGSTGGVGGDGIMKGSSNSFDITVVNTGTIAGGGGGGGGAGSYYKTAETFGSPTATNGGSGGDGAGVTGFSRTQGGPSSSNTDRYVLSTDGGQGGALGENGQAGQASPSPGQIATNNGPGGKAGKAVGSDIELAVSGTIIGTIG